MLQFPSKLVSKMIIIEIEVFNFRMRKMLKYFQYKII